MIALADYIITRFKQAGVKQVFGVPGDYQLELLDYFERDPEIEWVGNANELGAAYAADGYARVKVGMAVCVTTFGVGELSALGGIGGAVAERLPVVHLVGSPRSNLQHANALVHHTLNLPGQYKIFSEMSRPMSAETCVLIDVPDEGLGDAIDSALRTCLTESRPVYIDVPLDYNHKQISADALKTPLPSLSAPRTWVARNITDPPISDVSEEVIKEIVSRFNAAKNPVVLADLYAERYGMRTVVRELVTKTGVPAFCSVTSKSLLDEQAGSFSGWYGGNNSLDPVKDLIQGSDLVLHIGAMKSDTNTGRFTLSLGMSVEFYSDTTKIGAAEYPGTDMRHIVPALIPLLAKKGATNITDKIARGLVLPSTTEAGTGAILQNWFWPRMAAWFRDGDVLLGDMGTSAFGMLPMALPSDCQYHTQCMWGAIGWSVGAALGAAFAANEVGMKRTVLFVGDGSLQLTVQEIGTMVRRGLTPYIFVINNDGYEIERLIHGPNAKYNDIANWDYTMLLPLFAGRTSAKHETHSVRTQGELQALLDDPAFAVPDRIRLIEVFVPRGDAPVVLENLLQKKL